MGKDDETAFGMLYERYFSLLFTYAIGKTGDHFVAQEVVQELFINLWQQRNQVSIASSVRAYLFTAAKNLVIDQYRREAARSHHRDCFTDPQPLFTNQTEEQLQADELLQTYERLLLHLPDKCRRVFGLSRQAYSHREIARMEGITEKTVEQHITKALRLLRKHLPTHLVVPLLLSLIR